MNYTIISFLFRYTFQIFAAIRIENVCNAFIILLCALSVSCDSTESNSVQIALPELQVLVVSTTTKDDYAESIIDLMKTCKITTNCIPWSEMNEEIANAFDVVIVAGQGRGYFAPVSSLEIQKPVLAYGPYGSKYLGSMQLKNGYPYT